MAKYDEEFKAQAMRLVRDDGVGATVVANIAAVSATGCPGCVGQYSGTQRVPGSPLR